MCGIVGYIDYKVNHDPSILHSMMNSQIRRGPDESGSFLDDQDGFQIALGHRRLSILDISNHSSQPMKFENLYIVYNGEVYNFLAIKQELMKQGYTFFSGGDTEVVLKAFHYWGPSCVHQFRGMFAFCIYDKSKKRLYLMRDRVGVKPLFYSKTNDYFTFSSEIRSFQYFTPFKSNISQQGMNLYFYYGYVPAPSTIFESVYKIKPGHYIEYDIIKNDFSEKKYWQLSTYYEKLKLELNEAEATHILEDLLRDAFSLRMISDMPVGVLLSGGVDSSLVASILQANSSMPLKTFTMGFEKQEFNEAHHAKKIANHLGTEHYEEICTWKDAEAIIKVIPDIYDEPFADSSAIPTSLVAKLCKQEVSVVLSGDGGDELFCGYTSYLLNKRRFELIDKIPFPTVMKKMLDLIPDPIMSGYKINFDLYCRYLRLKSVFLFDNVEDRYRSISQIFSYYDLSKMLLGNQSLSGTQHHYDGISFVEKMMLMDFNYYLPDDIMVKVDKASMFYSLEGREPLLDHKILEFAAQLPMHLKQNKYVLKKILGKYLPKEHFVRKKQGFGVPVNGWLRKELRYLITLFLDERRIKKQGIFNEKYISSLCDSFLNARTNDNKVWTLLVFQMWYQKYFNEAF